MDEVIYAQLITLLDVCERLKKESGARETYIYYSGAVDILKKLKRKIESCEKDGI